MGTNARMHFAISFSSLDEKLFCCHLSTFLYLFECDHEQYLSKAKPGRVLFGQKKLNGPCVSKAARPGDVAQWTRANGNKRNAVSGVNRNWLPAIGRKVPKAQGAGTTESGAQLAQNQFPYLAEDRWVCTNSPYLAQNILVLVLERDE